MSGGMTRAHGILVLNMMKGVGSSPFTPYMALMTTLPDDDGVGGVEAAYTGYARQIPTFGTATNGSSGSLQHANTNIVIYDPLTALTTFAGVVLFDALTGGAARYVGTITSGGSAVPAGHSPRFPAGSIIVVED